MGYSEKTGMPDELMAAVSVSGPVSNKIDTSYKQERIAELDGRYGDASAGDPTEVDVLVVTTVDEDISVTVFNRGVALLTGDSEAMRRLHRFFGTIESELGRQ
jgi:hypothetical protein